MKKEFFEQPKIEIISLGEVDAILTKSGGNNDLPEDEWD